MKKLRYTIYIFLISGLAILSSCEDEIKIDEGDLTKNLVLNSIINPDSLFSVELSETKSIPGSSSSYYPIKGATVMLYEDDTEKGTLSYTETTSDSAAVYEYNSFYPVTDKTYRIEVSNTEYDDISCETSIPATVAIESLDTISNADDYDMTFELTFKDSANVTNYYRILLRTTRGYISTEWNEETQTDDTVICVYSSMQSTYLDSDDPVFVATENADDYLLDTESDENEFNIFSDDLFNGETYTLEFTHTGRYFNNLYVEKDKGEFYSLTVLLQSISYEEYEYLRTYANFEWNEGGTLTEPIQVYSNIDNGTGIFASFSTDSVTLINGEYPKDGINYVYEED